MDWIKLYENGALTLIIVGIGIGFWRAATWMKPLVLQWFAEETELKKELTKTATTNTQALSSQQPQLQKIAVGIEAIDHRTSDPESILSNVQANQKLDILIRDNATSKLAERKFAQAGIAACNALIEHHPELAKAIELLREVEES